MSIDPTDAFGRKHTYLRLSIMDSCNSRCLYCVLNEPFTSSPSSKLTNSNEIFGISGIFVEQSGTSKIRITGGEPLVRQNFDETIQKLVTLNISLGVTTNGMLLDRYFNLLRVHNAQHLNTSTDSLEQERSKQITKRDLLLQVRESIMCSIDLGFKIESDAVITRGINDDELLPLMTLSYRYPIEMRFIESMSFHGNTWERRKIISVNEMFSTIAREYNYIKLVDEKHDTSRKYRLTENSKGIFGFMSTASNAFCGGCSCMRLTFDGKMKNCLFGAEGSDLPKLCRQDKDTSNLIKEGVWRKHREKGGQFTETNTVDSQKMVSRSIIKIGG